MGEAMTDVPMKDALKMIAVIVAAGTIFMVFRLVDYNYAKSEFRGTLDSACDSDTKCN